MSSSNVNSSGYIGQPGTKSLSGTAIAEQIAKLPAAGGQLQLEAATYYVTAPIVITANNVSIVGLSRHATRIVFDFQGACFECKGSAIEIKHMTITGPDEAKYSEATGVKIRQQQCRVEDVHFFACKVGVAAGGPQALVIDCNIAPLGLDGCGSLVSADVDLTAENDVRVLDCGASFCKKSSIILKKVSGASSIIGVRFFFPTFGTTAAPCILVGDASGAIYDLTILDVSNIGGGHESMVKVACSGTQTVGFIDIGSVYNSGGSFGLDIDMGSRSSSINIHDAVVAATTGAAFKFQNVAPASGSDGGLILRGCRSKVDCASALSLNATCPKPLISGCSFNGAAANPVDLGAQAVGAFTSNALKGAAQNPGTVTLANNIAI